MNKIVIKKVRIRLESFNYILLTSSCYQIMDLIRGYDVYRSNCVPLPTKKKIYCVLRSPHVDKKSREHFEIRIHRRILNISYNPKIDVFKVLSHLEVPAGVLCQIYLL